MGNYLHQVERFIEEHHLLSQGDKVLVALSGGGDSVALLLMLRQLGYHCTAAHCNFALRGEESDRDETFVTTFCQKLQIPLRVIHFDTKVYAERYHLSIEMAARELRYHWFENLRRECDMAAIAVAHHRDDSIETLLLNLIRGTGINGLCGIRPLNGYIIRPLLCLSRADVLDYLEHLHQSYVTDSSNLHDEFTRNKIRLCLLPLMEQINPSVRESLQHTATHLYQASLIYNKGIADGRSRVMCGENIVIARLLAEPSPLALLFELLSPLGFNSAQVDDIWGTLQGQPGKIFVSDIYRVVKDRKLLLVSRISDKEVEEEVPQISYKDQPYSVDLEIPKGPWTVCFDAEKLKGALQLRKWKHGDKFVPFGMKGQKLVSDFLTDCKRSVVQKEEQWVLCCGDEIVWVIGLRTDNRFRVDAATRRIRIASIKKK